MSTYHTCSTCKYFNTAESVCTHDKQYLMDRKVKPDWGRQCQLYEEKPTFNDEAAMLETLQGIHRKVLAAWPLAPWLQMSHSDVLMKGGDQATFYTLSRTFPVVSSDLQVASVTCGDLLTPSEDLANYQCYAVERMVYHLEGRIQWLSSTFQKGEPLGSGGWAHNPRLKKNLDKLRSGNPNANVVVILSKESWYRLDLDDDDDGVEGYKMRDPNTFLYRSPIWSGADMNYAFIPGSLLFATRRQSNALPPQRTVNYSAHGLGLQLIQQSNEPHAKDSYLLRTLCSAALTDPYKAIAF